MVTLREGVGADQEIGHDALALAAATAVALPDAAGEGGGFDSEVRVGDAQGVQAFSEQHWILECRRNFGPDHRAGAQGAFPEARRSASAEAAPWVGSAKKTSSSTLVSTAVITLRLESWP
jgi:hypothetical protein